MILYWWIKNMSKNCFCCIGPIFRPDLNSPHSDFWNGLPVVTLAGVRTGASGWGVPSLLPPPLLPPGPGAVPGFGAMLDYHLNQLQCFAFLSWIIIGVFKNWGPGEKWFLMIGWGGVLKMGHRRASFFILFQTFNPKISKKFPLQIISFPILVRKT